MDKLDLIREQKQQLKKKIMQLQGQKVSENNLSQQAMAALHQKKAKLQHERLQQEKYRKMQEEYTQRKAQLERQKQLQKIRNQKRMIELEVGMKRIVLNGVQQKVKGINSDQLLTRAMLNNAEGFEGNKLQVGKSKQQIKNEFEKYLLKQNIKKQKPKHDLYQLNQKRFELFEKKEQLLMRQVLLKQIINNSDESTLQEIDVMNCSKEELEKLLEELGIDIQDYKHPLDSKVLMQNYPKIQESIKQNLVQKKLELETEEERTHKLRAQKAQLRDWVRQYPDQSVVNQVSQILDQLLLKLVYDYQKRHFPLTKQEKDQKIGELQKEYETILFENEFYELSQQIVEVIQQKVSRQILQETVKQIHQLHEFAHQTTEMSFDWMLTKKNYLEYIKTQDRRLDMISLNFKNDSDNIRYDKNDRKPQDKLNPNSKDSQSNVFQTQKNTSELINDIKLLTTEEQFFGQVVIQIKRQVVEVIDQNDFKVKNENGLYVISPKGIKLVSEQKDLSKNIFTFPKQLKSIRNVKKLNNLWLIQTNDSLYAYSPWNLQFIPVAIGERINSPCGSFTNIQMYPTFTLLGSLCSVLIGFQKGQLMKYNFNRNRINSTQTNITHYIPLGPHIKTGDEPAFPLNNRNVIQFKTEKPKQGDIMHQFRQFFDFHTSQIISVSYYKDNMFITVDKTLNCSIWLYDMRRGIKSYEPYYTFKIRSQYKTYKQSENPRFRDLYPSSSIPQSGQELYKKWMQHQTYLKLQIYNNPKKNSAYFRSPKWDSEKDEQPIWKLNYDQKTKKVIKIFQTYYNLIDGKNDCRQVKVWKEYVIFLVERQHVMRSDLKTVKIYTWSIDEKKLRTVAIQFDTFQEQKVFSFQIIQNKVDTNEFPLIATVSSGKILLFSMLSGQLLKDISEEKNCSKVKNYNFTSIQKGYFDNFYGITRRSIVQFIIKNSNSKQKKTEFSKTIDLTKKKYNNLI